MRFLLLVSMLFTTVLVHGQGRVFYTGALPEFAVSRAMGAQFGVTAKVESMHGAYRQSSELSGRWQHIHERTDIQLFVINKINPFWRLSVGYQHRFLGGGGLVYRTIQQIAAVQQNTGYRLGHRFRTDQTFSAPETPEFRFRYRLSAEVALEGQSVDPREFYLKFSEELIYSNQGGKSGLENRLVAVLGHNFSRTFKLETGLDYRTDRFLDGDFHQRLWLKIGLFLNI